MSGGYSVVTKIGNVRAAETDSLWIPGKQRPAGKYGVVYTHGASAPIQWLDGSRWGSNQIAAMITAAGIPGISAEMGGDAFGNTTATNAIDAAITYMGAQLGTPTTKVHLVGGSMGFHTAVKYAILNPTKVASITGLIPMSDIDALYQANTLGLRAAIGTAWGVTYPTALPAGAIIMSSASALNGVVPTQLFYSTADTAVAPASVTAIGATLGSNPITIADTVSGHTETTIDKIADLGGAGTAKTIIDYLLANGA